MIYYSLKNKPQGDVTLEFLDSAGKVVNTFSSKARGTASARRRPDDEEFRPAPPARVPAQQGMNRFVWNLRYPDATSFPGLIMWAGQRHRAARLAGDVPGPADRGRQVANPGRSR